MQSTRDSAADDNAAAPQLACETLPGRSGPVMLMIHGMLSSRRQWERNRQALSAAVRPVLIDLWGHGDSPTPDDPALYTVDALVAAIDEVRMRHQAEQIVLCTQSFGAGLGLHYCLQHPQRVLAHIFTNSMSALSRPEAFDASRNREARIELIRSKGSEGLATMPFHPRNAKRLDPDVRQILVDAANAVSPEAFIRLTGETRAHLSVIDRIAEIQCPTLMVNGRWEKGFQPLRDQAQQLLPSLRIADIEAGHAVNLEQAEAFNEAVLGFLRDVLPAHVLASGEPAAPH